MDRFFSVFGKITIGTVVLILILTAGYYIGTHKNELGIDITPTPSLPQAMMTPSPAVAKTTSTPNTAPSGTTISAGSTNPYSISIPTGWTQNREQQADIQLDKLILNKNGYTLSIYQAPMGGGVCLYDGDPAFQGPSQSFSQYLDIKGTPFLMRRSWDIDPQKAQQIYTVCQKTQDLYGTITTFGSISYETPKNADEKILVQMDAIVASLKKQ